MHKWQQWRMHKCMCMHGLKLRWRYAYYESSTFLCRRTSTFLFLFRCTFIFSKKQTMYFYTFSKKQTILACVIISVQTISCRNGILYDFLSSFMKDITKANYVTDDALEHIELIKGSSCSTFQTVFSYSTVFSDKWPVSSEQTKKYLLLPAYSCMHSRFQTKCLCNSTWKCTNHFR